MITMTFDVSLKNDLFKKVWYNDGRGGDSVLVAAHGA